MSDSACAIIIIESDVSFKFGNMTMRNPAFHRLIGGKKAYCDNTDHPFIKYTPVGYTRRQYDLDYYRRVVGNWNSKNTEDWWKLVDSINWCFQDLEYPYLYKL